MDGTDPDITFDEEGVCSHCRRFENVIQPRWHPDVSGEPMLEALVNTIKEAGKNHEYDCVIGMSGGVDSSYLAYKAKELGLRPLAVHVDAGWNSELAVKNIENIVKALDIDLHTHVVDWEEVRDLQQAFFRAGVANLDIPQDHAFVAAVFHYASAQGIKYILNGSNFATESILPTAWGHNALDLRHIKAIHKRFGKKKLRTYPTINFFTYYLYYPFVKKLRVVCPLNYMYYDKADAMKLLEEKLGWTYYGGKHYESRFTKFFQAHYLPEKFGYDKRKAHLSSLIVTGQMTRDDAMAEMNKPLYDSVELEEDRRFVIKKLGLNQKEFDEIMAQPCRSYRDYPSNEWLFELKGRVLQLFNRKKT